MGDGRNYGDGSYAGDTGLTYTENLNRYEDSVRQSQHLSSLSSGQPSSSSSSSLDIDLNDVIDFLVALVRRIIATTKAIAFAISIILMGLVLCFSFCAFVLVNLPKEVVERRKRSECYNDIFFNLVKQFSSKAYDQSNGLTQITDPTTEPKANRRRLRRDK